ncbi:MAG TPA: hypothetical protein VH413_04990 [Verrucomicrobiae bacterium]|jgi:hypothetical protein|nr:hypothetical protein [Verrucomicrobiae bacterium]
MARKKSTNKSSPSPANKRRKKAVITLENILELPDPMGFESKRTPVSMDEMLRWCESCLPMWNSQPEAEERRLRGKCMVEFVL